MRARFLSSFEFGLVLRRVLFEKPVVADGHIHHARRLVEQGTSGLNGDLHLDQQVADGRQTLDGHAELLTAGRIVAGDPIGCLGDAGRLGGDTDTGSVHQRRDVGSQAAFALADQLARRIVEEDLARRRAVNAELVFQPADVHGRARFADEQAQAETAAAIGLAAGQHEQDFAAAVGDEPLDAVQEPVALVVLEGFEFDGLQVRAGVRLGQDHGAGHLAVGKRRQVFLLDLFVGERVDRLGDALKAEDVHQRRVGPRDDLGGDRVDQVGEVQAAEPIGQREAHHLGLGQLLQGLGHALRTRDGAVLVECVALPIDVFGPRRDEVGAEFAERVEDHVVVLHGLLGVLGRVVAFAGEAEVILDQGGQVRPMSSMC